MDIINPLIAVIAENKRQIAESGHTPGQDFAPVAVRVIGQQFPDCRGSSAGTQNEQIRREFQKSFNRPPAFSREFIHKCEAVRFKFPAVEILP